MYRLPAWLGQITFEPIESPPSEACLHYMDDYGYDPDMPVYRGFATPEFMAQFKLQRPDVANSLQLLFGPYGIVDPAPAQEPFRVAELQVGDVVLDVEAEYDA